MMSKFGFFGNGPSSYSNMNTYFIIGGILLLLIISAFIIYYYVVPAFSNKGVKYNHNNEHGTGENVGDKTAELLFFYANWCPHCKTAKPVWNELKETYSDRVVNGYTIVFTDVDCSEENDTAEQLMNRYNVEGFPTIKLVKDGQVIEYDAKPTKDLLEQFLNTVL
jgi:thiol-disulfide isomerase/thioredoxin